MKITALLLSVAMAASTVWAQDESTQMKMQAISVAQADAQYNDMKAIATEIFAFEEEKATAKLIEGSVQTVVNYEQFLHGAAVGTIGVRTIEFVGRMATPSGHKIRSLSRNGAFKVVRKATIPVVGVAVLVGTGSDFVITYSKTEFQKLENQVAIKKQELVSKIKAFEAHTAKIGMVSNGSVISYEGLEDTQIKALGGMAAVGYDMSALRNATK